MQAGMRLRLLNNFASGLNDYYTKNLATVGSSY